MAEPMRVLTLGLGKSRCAEGSCTVPGVSACCLEDMYLCTSIFVQKLRVISKFVRSQSDSVAIYPSA